MCSSDLVASLFEGVEATGALIGVAGTWTSIAAIDLDLAEYDPDQTHHHRMSAAAVRDITGALSLLTVEETAAIPAMDPARAPVILAGAVVAAGVLDHLAANEVVISERDTLDGLARELLGLA